MRACREFIAYPEALLPPDLAPFEALTPSLPPPRPASPAVARRTRHPVRAMRAFAPAPAPALAPAPSPWDHPLAIGALLVALPPVGITMLWASPRFGFAGKLAVTLFTAFAMMLAAIVAAVAILLA